jgi:hypothetical protein
LKYGRRLANPLSQCIDEFQNKASSQAFSLKLVLGAALQGRKEIFSDTYKSSDSVFQCAVSHFCRLSADILESTADIYLS